MAKGRNKTGRKWAHKSTGLKKDGVKPMGAVLTEKRVDEIKKLGKQGALTMDEKLGILEMYQNETDTNIIAQKFNRTPDAIRKFLWRYADTSKIARARLQGGAETLADRIVEQANVDQALEVMDRLDILSKKREKAAPASSFNLIIGIPAASGASRGQAAIPVPSQKQIDDAIDAEAKVVS